MVMQHAAVAVAGVFAEAGVGHHHHFRHGVLADTRHARNQAVFVPGVAAIGIQVVRYAKGHHRLDTGAGIALDFLGQQLLGDTIDTGHAGDRHEIIDALFDENRQDQVFKAELGFLEDRAQGLVLAQAAGTNGRELVDMTAPGNLNGVYLMPVARQ